MRDMNKAILGFIVGIVLVVLAGLFLFSGSEPQETSDLPLPETHEYYWSTTCPHCAVVNEFMEGWEHTGEFALEKYETANPSNASRLQTRALSCDIPPTQIGVPLMYTPEGKCIVGDQPIIDYLNFLYPNEDTN